MGTCVLTWKAQTLSPSHLKALSSLTLAVGAVLGSKQCYCLVLVYFAVIEHVWAWLGAGYYTEEVMASMNQALRPIGLQVRCHWS
jgi:hypothetical protein